MEQCPRLSLGCRYRPGSSAPGAGWGGRRVKPARRWRSQAAGPGLQRPPPAFYPARPGSGAGGRRVPASSLLGRRGGRSGRGGCAANRRGGPVRAPRRLSAGWDRSAACDSATPRPRAPRPAPAGEPPSPVGSRPVCRGAAHRSPRVAARRWHPTPTSDPGLGAGASEGPGGRCAPGACWGSRPGLEEEDRSEGRSAFPPAPPGFCGEGRRGGGDAKAPRGRPSVPRESSSPFLTRRRQPEAPGPILEAKGQERRLKRPSGWSAKIRALAFKKKINKQKSRVLLAAAGTRINPVGLATQKDLCPRGPAATRLQ